MLNILQSLNKLEALNQMTGHVHEYSNGGGWYWRWKDGIYGAGSIVLEEDKEDKYGVGKNSVHKRNTKWRNWLIPFQFWKGEFDSV